MPQDKTKLKTSRGWLIPALRYAWLTTKHKWFVFLAGRKIGCPLWRLLTHDLSKYGPHELVHYGRQFFGTGDHQEDFGKAWLHHQNINDHHWEYWIFRTKHDQDKNPSKILPMSDGAVLEMISDWFGASRAYEGAWPWFDEWTWYDENFKRMKLHPETEQKVKEKVWLFWKQ